jgi:hypothetical protein
MLSVVEEIVLLPRKWWAETMLSVVEKLSCCQESGGQRGTRTPDILLVRQAL